MYLLYAIFLLLPTNLGWHFIGPTSFVRGLLVDYLIPTVYLQDILISLFIFWYFWRGGKSLITALLTNKIFILVVYLGFVFLLCSGLTPLSLSYALRWFLYSLFGVLLSTLNKTTVERCIRILFVGSFLVACLALLQTFRQASVFDNYTIFGEQPYSAATPGVVKESLFGFTYIPPYGLFRHPNTLGGFLTLVIVLTSYYLLRSPEFFKERGLFIPGLLFCAVAVLASFSLTASVICLLGLFSLYLDAKGLRWLGVCSVLLCFLVVLTSYYVKSGSVSITRRAHLNVAGVAMLSEKPVFGWGPGLTTRYIEDYFTSTSSLRFVQPVHNLFLLLGVEVGLLGLILFCSILYEVYTNTTLIGRLLITLIILLGTFDHYFLTMHQTQLLMWIILGLGYRQKTPSLNIIE